MEDRRAAKTKRAIRIAFLELLKQKSINRISVVEISKLADLGRGTFYLHYKDVYDLMEQLENELIYNIELFYDQSYPCDNSMKILNFTDKLTEYMETNREVFLVLARIENGGRTLEKIKKFFNHKLQADSSCSVTEADKVEVIFIVAGVFGVLETWLCEEMKMPGKAVSELLHKLLLKFES